MFRHTVNHLIAGLGMSAMYAGTALSNQKKTKRIPVIYMSLLVLKELAKDKISVGCAACDWKKAGIY